MRGPERFKPLAADEMTPAQKNLMELLTSGKIEGGRRGPVNTLLRCPDIGEGIRRFGAYERFHSTPPAKLSELAVLVTIRNVGAQFPWYAHHRAGVQAGLSEAVVSAEVGGARGGRVDGGDRILFDRFAADECRSNPAPVALR